MDRSQALDRVKDIVTGKREEEYGNPENNFETIAEFWSTYLSYAVTKRDVAVMMTLLKVARLKTAPLHLDSVLDSMGYMACYSEMVVIPPKPDAS